jgi:hypothetical protein
VFAGDLRHAGRVFVQPAGRLGRGPRQEHFRQDGREQRRPADAGRVPQGVPAGRGAVQNAGPLKWLCAPPLARTQQRTSYHTRTHGRVFFWFSW